MIDRLFSVRPKPGIDPVGFKFAIHNWCNYRGYLLSTLTTPTGDEYIVWGKYKS